MAMPIEQQQQQQANKYYCRICKKGFGCGRALGGHMRAHGINDVGTIADDAIADDDPSGSSEGDDKPGPGHRRMYGLRTNPNRFKSCRACENCGKEFLSWKSFLEHGKCSSDDEGDDEFSVSSDLGDGDADDDDGTAAFDRGYAGWSKGKRSRRAKAAAAAAAIGSEEEDLAHCLVMLSAAHAEPIIAVETEESCASASKEEDRQHTVGWTPEKAKAPVPLSSTVPRGMFECKACKKVFNSHQALGGHRASHKKVKGCFAAKLDELDEPPPVDNELDAQVVEAATDVAMAIVPFDCESTPPLSMPLKKKLKVHECSICHRIFESGQALGGHKRCHWITSNSPDPAAAGKFHITASASGEGHHQLTFGPMFEPSGPLDLNLPVSGDDITSETRQVNVGSPLRLEVPAVYLQPWFDESTNYKKSRKCTTNSNSKNNNTNPNDNANNDRTSIIKLDDEADSRVKLAKLSDLKDMNIRGEALPWLQVGIGSSINDGFDQ